MLAPTILWGEIHSILRGGNITEPMITQFQYYSAVMGNFIIFGSTLDTTNSIYQIFKDILQLILQTAQQSYRPENKR